MLNFLKNYPIWAFAIYIFLGLEVRNVNANVHFYGQPQFITLDGNNIRSYLWDSGVFNQDPSTNNSPGFEWPKGSGRFAIFTSGLTVASYVNGQLRMAANSYTGELGPGIIIGGVPTTKPNFKFYKINEWDNCQTNPDYANWGLMVPYGAPYVDINNNGQYDDCIDKPGIFNARQTIFIAMTDGFPENHNPSEGFGGGTAPLNADFRLTAWCYNIPPLENIQFLKWNIINQNNFKWDSTYFSIVADPDLGDATDDYIGCDTITDMGYCYNSDNIDGLGNPPTYGLNPPAVGMQFLRTPILNSIQLGMTSFTYFSNPSTPGPICERDPDNPVEAYRYMKGYKKDGTPWLNPETIPPFQTKFCFPGLPGGPGWNESMGSIPNCGGDTTGIIQQNPAGDRRFVISSGSLQLSINPGDTQTIVIGQHISRGSNNLNSVTKLLASSLAYQYLFQNNFDFSVSGIIRYSDNGNPVSEGYVKALKLDGNSGRVLTMDSTHINPDGSYTLTKVPFDEVDIMAYPSSELEDFIPTYYPGTVRWEDAISLFPDSNLINININVIRISSSMAPTNATIAGTVFTDSVTNILKDAIVYLRNAGNYFRFDISSDSGTFHLPDVAMGNYEVFVNRLGYSSDSQTVNVTNPNSTYNLDFNLNQIYVGITGNQTEIPSGFKLFQNYPNPFNPSTKIKFHLPEGSFVKLVVYDIMGREIKVLKEGKLNPGEYTYTFSAENLPSGVYFYSLSTINETLTKKMVLLK